MSRIRPIVIGLAIRDGSVLVAEGHDDVKGERFYRPPGGEIEFGEAAEVAMRREWREELNMELDSVQFLGVLENRFTFNGQAGHELVLVYSVEMPDGHDGHDGHDEPMTLREGDLAVRTEWLPLADVRSRAVRLYPQGIPELIDAAGLVPLVR